MPAELPASSRLKTYSDRSYVHTTLVRHQGTTVALAIDSKRRLFYSVLDFNAQALTPGGDTGKRSELDVNFWSEEPKELLFPAEIARAGFATAGAASLPRVQLGGVAEEGPGVVLLDDEVDPFRSSTGRLTAAYPFQAVSDGKHIFVFRQAVGAEHGDALFRLRNGACTGDKTHKNRETDSAENDLPVAADALLCDRFVLTGSELKPVHEVRYRRSRHRDQPESAKDSLGNTDMNGRPFFEPTLELGFAGKVTEGRFAVLLLPTIAANTRRWQFFLHNKAGERIDAVNVEQDQDGLFHTQGSRLYTSPDPKFRDAVLERSPGLCPSTGQHLVPRAPDPRFAESALAVTQGYAEVATGAAALELGTKPYTVEAWIKPTALGGTILSTRGGADGTAPGGMKVALDRGGRLVVTHCLADGGTSVTNINGRYVVAGKYTHIGLAFNGSNLTLYVQGKWTNWSYVTPAAVTGSRLLIGADAGTGGTPTDFFSGTIDEVRVWGRRRHGLEIWADHGFRLVGDEPGLAAYYRFDEGVGSTAYDQGAHHLDAALHGTTSWVASDAPVADHPGIRRESFRISGRTVAGGLTAALHHQQEDGAVGHDGDARPLKRQARVLLAWTASATASATAGAGASGAVGRIATLDLAVAHDGRLAQLPDVLDLPVVGASLHTVDPKRENELKKDEIPPVAAELTAAESDLEYLKGDRRNPQGLNEFLRGALSAVRGAGGLAEADGSSTDCSIVLEIEGSGFTGSSYFRHLRVRTDDKGDNQLEAAEGAPDTADSGTQWRAVRSGSGHWTLRNVSTQQYVCWSGKNVVMAADGSALHYTPGSHKLTGGGNDLRWDGGGVVMADAYVMDGSSVGVGVTVVPTQPAEDGAIKATAEATSGLRRLGALKSATDDPEYINALTEQRTKLRNELKDKRDELGRVTGGTKGRSDHTEPTVHLGQDRCGLGWSGALLDFAKTSSTPHLTDSGTGHLGLYFRDEQDRLTGLFYDTNVGRSGKTLAASERTTVQLTARDAGIDLKDVTATIAADATGPFADRCTLTLSGKGSKGGETETWSLLPRRATELADALNGLRAEPADVGAVAKFKDGVLTLAAPGARRALAAGELLDVGGAVYALTAATAAQATELRLNHGPSTAQYAVGTKVRLISYDPSLVTHSRPGSSAAFGSRLVTAALIGTTGSVVNGTGRDRGEARPPRWWGDLPGRALIFATGTRLPSLPADSRSTVKHTDDLTLEAWVHPKTGGTARIVHANVPDPTTGTDSRYTLALGEAGTDGRRPLLAGVGDSFATSRGTVPDESWTHVAAAFEQSWALDFAHERAVVESPHAADLDISRDLTLEVFLQARTLTGVQGLLSKGRIDDGTGKRVPYQLSLAADGKLVFAFEDGDGKEVRAVSSAGIEAGKFHRIAVVRKLGSTREEKTGSKTISIVDAKGAAKDMVIEAIESVAISKWSDITFHIDGREAGHSRYAGAPDLGHPGPLDIGRARRGAADQPFSGVISEVRIWSTARPAADLGATLPYGEETGPGGTRVRPEGLVAHWRFEENEGNAAQDENGSHTAKVRGAVWTKNPDPKGSVFRLYLNGRATQARTLKADEVPNQGSYGEGQFAIGGRVNGSNAAERYLGVLEEVRVWRTARTEEQVLDNLYGRLTGDTADLLAYYPFDDESTDVDATALKDHGPRGCDLPLGEVTAARPAPVMSTAPISSDTPEVRSAFATGQPLFVQKIATAPAVSEYADLQRMRDGSTRGVLKRCYAYVQGGQWQLITGFKLGDLKSEWVGQVQFDPQLVGYIEGAPPVPSENLVATRRPGSLSYLNTTSVEFTQADQVVQSLSSSAETSVDASLEFEANAELNLKSRIITAPLGIGISVPVTEVTLGLRGGGKLEYSNGWGDQTELSEGANTTRSTLVGLGGGWESDRTDQQIDAENGRRFQPANIGFALVQSETADVFALRLAHTGAVVAYRMLPNPDIPRDWNLLPFGINPRYVKQGTLDGTVGFKAGAKLLDPDYADANGRGDHSFFKPKEAYALKRRIIEDQQRRQAYYEGVSTETHRADPTAERARTLLSSFMGPVRSAEDTKADTSKEVDAFARRDIVNTYAWSADGGFFAETTETTDVVTETTSGSYSFNGHATAGATVGFKVYGNGFGLQLDASVGGSLSRTRSRSREATRSFSLDVKVDTPGDMQKYDAESVPQYENGRAVEVAGRVDAYRFMTFYLDSDKNNFEDFFGKVVDPNWLNGPTANAAALRQANQSDHKPPCWRVLHRVTFVSRKLPDTLATGAPPLEKAMREANVSSNFELVRKLEPYVDRAVRSRAVLAVQVREAIKVHLPELTAHSEAIEKFFGDYFGLD